MEIKLSYQEMKTNHPDLISVLVEKIRSSNSKDKNKSEKDYDFYYSYGVAIKGHSFGEMMNQIHNNEKEPEKNSAQIMNEKLNSIIGLSLTISAGRTKRYIALNDKPKLFVDKLSEIYSKDIEENKKEDERLAKLTPDERNRETQEIINELSGMGGFVGFNMGNNGITRIEPQKVEYNEDDILDKISRVGMDGLTNGEKKFLEECSKNK